MTPARTPTATEPAHRTDQRAGRGWILIATLLAVIAGSFLALAPLNSESAQWSTSGTAVTADRDSTPGSQLGQRPVRRSLVSSEGWSVVVLLAVPVIICLLPLLGGARSRFVLAAGATVLLGGCVMLGWLALGIFYVPSTVAMLVAALRSFSAGAVGETGAAAGS